MRAWLARDRGAHAEGPRHQYSAEAFDVDLAQIDHHFGPYLNRHRVALER